MHIHRVSVTFTIAIETAQRLETVCHRDHLTRGRVIDAAVAHYVSETTPAPPLRRVFGSDLSVALDEAVAALMAAGAPETTAGEAVRVAGLRNSRAMVIIAGRALARAGWTRHRRSTGGRGYYYLSGAPPPEPPAEGEPDHSEEERS